MNDSDRPSISLLELADAIERFEGGEDWNIDGLEGFNMGTWWVINDLSSVDVFDYRGRSCGSVGCAAGCAVALGIEKGLIDDEWKKIIFKDWLGIEGIAIDLLIGRGTKNFIFKGRVYYLNECLSKLFMGKDWRSDENFFFDTIVNITPKQIADKLRELYWCMFSKWPGPPI